MEPFLLQEGLWEIPEERWGPHPTEPAPHVRQERTLGLLPIAIKTLSSEEGPPPLRGTQKPWGGAPVRREERSQVGWGQLELPDQTGRFGGGGGSRAAGREAGRGVGGGRHWPPRGGLPLSPRGLLPHSLSVMIPGLQSVPSPP